MRKSERSGGVCKDTQTGRDEEDTKGRGITQKEASVLTLSFSL